MSVDPGELSRLLLGADPRLALVTGLAVLARVLPALWLAPFPGGRWAPPAVKLGLGLALALVLAPQLLPQARELEQAGAPLLILVLVKEALVGGAMGFVLAVVFWGVEAAGQLMAISLTGRQDSTPALGNLMLLLSIVLFLLLGGHRVFITALGASYLALPLSRLPGAAGLGGLAWLVIRVTGDLFLVAVALAAPVLAALLLADLALGLMGRLEAPLGSPAIGQPLRLLVGIAAVLLTVGLLGEAVQPFLEQALGQVMQVTPAILRAP